MGIILDTDSLKEEFTELSKMRNPDADELFSSLGYKQIENDSKIEKVVYEYKDKDFNKQIIFTPSSSRVDIIQKNNYSEEDMRNYDTRDFEMNITLSFEEIKAISIKAKNLGFTK